MFIVVMSMVSGRVSMALVRHVYSDVVGHVLLDVAEAAATDDADDAECDRDCRDISLRTFAIECVVVTYHSRRRGRRKHRSSVQQRPESPIWSRSQPHLAAP